MYAVFVRLFIYICFCALYFFVRIDLLLERLCGSVRIKRNQHVNHTLFNGVDDNEKIRDRKRNVDV